MANEFIVRNGLIALNNSQITGSLDVSGDVSITGFPSVSASLATTVNTSGTPVNNQLAIFTDSNTIEGDSNITWDGSIFTINGTGSVDLLQVDDKLQGNGSGFQFFAFNEDTVKVKFANWYSSNDRQYGMGQLWFETWFAAIDNNADPALRDERRIGFYLEEPDAGSTDSGTPGQHPSNARFYVDVNGAYLSGSFQASGDITASNAQLTTIAGPSDQLLELGTYPVGYDVISAFAITGSGLIVSASTLASNHYNMLKVGDIELIDLKSLVNPNTFLIHNVTQFSITSGSDGGDIASANYLMTHGGGSFVLYNNGTNMFSVNNGAVTFNTTTTQFTVQNSTGDINLIPATGDVKHRVNNTATTSSVHSFSVYDADPSTVTGASVKNLPASDVIFKGTTISGSLVYFGEESGNLSTGVSNGYQFSYGNGATGTIGIPVPVDCYAKKLMFQAETFGTSCTIDLYTGSITTNPATDTGESITITGTEHGKVVDINPVFIAAGHYPIFKTSAVSGTYGNVRVGVFLEYPIEIGV